MSSSAVTRSPLSSDGAADALTDLGWTRQGDQFRKGGWIILNLREVQSAPHLGGHTHTLMDISGDGEMDEAVLEEVLVDAIPTWVPDDGDEYQLGWANRDPASLFEAARLALKNLREAVGDHLDEERESDLGDMIHQLHEMESELGG